MLGSWKKQMLKNQAGVLLTSRKFEVRDTEFYDVLCNHIICPKSLSTTMFLNLRTN